jgi:mannosyl-oligosaccharide alpha-1,2-mannosidase
VHLPFDKNAFMRKPPILVDQEHAKVKPPAIKDYTFPYLGDATVDVQSFTPKGGNRFNEWVHGDTPYEITEALMQHSDELARLRRTHIKSAMEHAWNGYKKYAFGQDELLPISASSRNNWGGMGVTLVDSLDTLWLMGMKDEFKEATEWVRGHLSFAHVGHVSVFETTIRSLGGLLSAYDWSGESVLLEKALDLGNRLAQSFSCDSGIPCPFISLSGEAAGGSSSSNVAEIGTLQVEFKI